MTIEDKMNVILINARLDKPESGIFYYIEFKDEGQRNTYEDRMGKENKLVEWGGATEGCYFFAEDPEDFEKTVTEIGFDNIKDLSAQWDL